MRIIMIGSAVVTALFLQSFSSRRAAPAPVLSDYQKEVIYYFHEIALGFEFGNASAISRKWNAPMKVFVDGSPSDILLQELNSIKDEINSLASDNFYIEIVAERKAANLILYIGNDEGYSMQYPEDAALAKANAGMYHIYWNKNNEIKKGHIFVKTNGIKEEEQRHVLREELTQSLGLGRDSDRFMDSIFRSSYSIPTQYATIDRELIRLLYHPKMKTGLSANEVEVVLTEILLSENGL